MSARGMLDGVLERSKGNTDAMVHESIILTSAFRSFGDEDEEGKEEIPLEDLEDDTALEGDSLEDEEEEF